MIGVHEQVGGEDVVIPHKAVLEVLAPGVERGLGKVLIGDATVEEVHEGIDGCHLTQCPPRMFLAQSRVHQGVGRRFFLTSVYNSRLAVFVMWITERETCLSEEAVTVFLRMRVITGVTVAHRCKHAHAARQLIVGIQTSLYGEEAVGTLVAVFLEDIDVVIADIATE